MSSFIAAADIAADLALRPEVAEHWTDESACAGMTVGGLAHHLLSQVGNTVRLVGAEPSDQPPITLLEHYQGAGWVDAELEDDVNVGIREGSDAEAAAGPEVLAAQVAELTERLPGVLAAREPGDAVWVPWQGWSLTLHDWLVTRMMEIVVHSDDLAASVGLETPEFPADVAGPVLDLLTRLSARRHGTTALVRTLTRPQRAPVSVTAFGA